MIVDTQSARSGPWTPRIALQLTVLAAAAFVYVTAETVPVGALTDMARELKVSEPLVGTLLAWYALVAAVTTIPLVRWTARWPRRRTLLLALVCLTVSQLVSALAPNFEVLACGRVVCAVTHGLMFAVVAPIAVRLVPASHAGRATTVIFVGTTLALVLGNPLTVAMSQLWSWRWAVVVVTVAAAVVTVAARLVLPVMAFSAAQLSAVGRHARHHRNRALVALSVLTLVAVAGHFISYTFILVVIRDVVGVRGANQAWLLAAFGVAGLVAMLLAARPSDRHPRAALSTCLAALAVAFAVLTALAFGGQHTAATAVLGTGAIVAWGAMAMATAPILQSAVMRSAPGDPDGASGWYVTAFQIGIMVGSLLGGLLYQNTGVPVMLAASAVLVSGAVVAVLTHSPLDGRK